MKCKTLINILGKYNHSNIVAALNLKPDNIVFISFDNDKEYYDNVKECTSRKLPNVQMEELVIENLTESDIRDVIYKFNYEDTFLNLSGGTKLMSILTYKAAQDSDMTMIYVDTENNKILKIGEIIEEIVHIDLELTVEDLVCSTGAEIIKNSTELYEKEEFKKLVDFMVNDYDAWKNVKGILRNSQIVKQFERYPLQVEIVTGGLKPDHIKYLDDFLSELSRRGMIKQYRLNSDHAQFDFTSKEAKTFVMMAGCWLEALTYRYIKEVKDVENVISGMLFVWDEAVKVHNELDVVAAVDSHLVCISCKDTNKYDVDELNELAVYADHLGGKRVIKIFVSTEKPERKKMTYQRAEEMNIHIVIFEGDVTNFRSKLYSIIDKAHA
ncbi:MAG: DUF1887 family CARF protein [Lutisporaceae bacterium]